MARPIRLRLSEEDSERLREILPGLPPRRSVTLRRVLLASSLLLIGALIAVATWHWDELRGLLERLLRWLGAAGR